jgi:hypothetical protein
MSVASRKLAAQKASPMEVGCAECQVRSLNGHLSELMQSISRGDRNAFVMLFEHTCGTVRASIDARLRDPQRAATVFAATYVEVWWLAGCHPGQEVDVVTWINRIVTRRSAETRPPSPSQEHMSGGAIDPKYLRPALELSSLLGRPVEPLTDIDLGRC